ncbi:MAG TPA: HPP family protein [Bryobacteraceae bacterium]
MAAGAHDRHTPFERHGPGHVHAVLDKLRLMSLMDRFPPRLVWAGYVLLCGFVTIALLSIVTMFTTNPFVFPSLGPTAYLYFFAPLARASSPRHALFGHAIAIACGYFALWSTGMVVPHGLEEGITWNTGIAAALSLGLTGAFMVLFRVSHPPAGATTLIVSLGLITKPLNLFILEVAVLALTIEAFVINRLAGLPYPFWEN